MLCSSDAEHGFRKIERRHLMTERKQDIRHFSSAASKLQYPAGLWPDRFAHGRCPGIQFRTRRDAVPESQIEGRRPFRPVFPNIFLEVVVAHVHWFKPP